MILLKNRDRNPSFKKGEYVEINDAGNYPMELSVDGVCEQETTTGKQLFNYASTDYLENTNTTLTGTGEDFTIASTGNGIRAYCLGQIDFDTLYRYMSTDYVISSLMLYIADESTYANFLDYSGKRTAININWSNNTQDLSSYQGKYLWLQIRGASSGTPYTKVNYKDFILSKTEVTSYEPFTGGQPSPSPDYPQEIKTITGNIKVTSCGKNLLDDTKLAITSGSRNGAKKIDSEGKITSIDPSADNRGFGYKYCDYFFTLGKGSYYLYYEIFTPTANKNAFMNIFNENNRIHASNFANKTGIISTKFTLDDISNIGIEFKLYEGEIRLWILKDGVQDTSYEKHLETQITANLPEGEFVGKLNDTYKDTLNVVYKDDGHYHLILNKMIGKYISNNDLQGNGETDTRLDFVTPTLPISANLTAIQLKGMILSNLMQSVRTQNTGFDGTTSVSKIRVSLSKNYANTHAEANTFLKNKNFVIYYRLIEERELDLGIVDTLLSYDEVTNVFSDSDLYPVINVKYYKDFEFDKILRSGYNIDEQEYEIAKKQMANGKRKRILSSYDDCIIKINLGLLDNKTYQEYKEQLDDGEFHYWSYKYNQYKKANFILTKPSITTEYAYDDNIGIDDMEITLEKSSDVS